MAGRYDVVFGTGHRELRNGDHAWRSSQLDKACQWLRDAGTRYAVSGLALGFDSDWADAALNAGLKLCAVIPFTGQPDRWNRQQKARWERLRAAAIREHIAGEVPDGIPARQRGAVINGLMTKRNTFGVERSTAIITDWEPGRFDGGTSATLRTAVGHARPGLHLNPVARTVTFHLPALADLEAYALVHTTCRHVARVATKAAIDEQLAGLHRAGHHNWRVRRARPHEVPGHCDDCLQELAEGALSTIGRPELLTVMA